MSGKRSKLLPLFMLLLLTTGALMPRAAFSLQDYRLAAQTESRPLNGIEFTLRDGGGVVETLSILSGGYTHIMLQGGSNLTQPEAEDAAREAVNLLVQENLLPGFTPGSTTPAIVYAAISNSDSSNSAIIWQLTFTEDAQPLCTVWIDDATKKLVSVSYVASGRTSTFMTPTVELTKELLLERWSVFLQEYYNLAQVTIETSYSNESRNIFTLEFTWLEGGNAVSCKLPLMLYDYDVIFCW